jgi:hypothetical protein
MSVEDRIRAEGLAKGGQSMDMLTKLLGVMRRRSID